MLADRHVFSANNGPAANLASTGDLLQRAAAGVWQNDLQQKSDLSAVLIGGAWILPRPLCMRCITWGGGTGRESRLAALTGLAGMFSRGCVLLHFRCLASYLSCKPPMQAWGNALLMALLSTVLPIYWLAPGNPAPRPQARGSGQHWPGVDAVCRMVAAGRIDFAAATGRHGAGDAEGGQSNVEPAAQRI